MMYVLEGGRFVKFKRNWTWIHQERQLFCLLLAVTLMLLVVSNGFLFFLLPVVIFCILIFLINKSIPGLFTEEVCLNETGVSLWYKGVLHKEFKWDTVAKVFRSSFSKGRGNTIVVVNNNGETIWFYRSKKIQRYLVEVYPPAKDMLTGGIEDFIHEHE